MNLPAQSHTVPTFNQCSVIQKYNPGSNQYVFEIGKGSIVRYAFPRLKCSNSRRGYFCCYCQLCLRPAD